MKEALHLKVVPFGLALGVTNGVGMLLLGLVSMWHGTGADMVHVVGSLYVGFAATVGGSILGLVWGFIDGFIMGVVIAWLYNFYVEKCCCKKEGV